MCVVQVEVAVRVVTLVEESAYIVFALAVYHVFGKNVLAVVVVAVLVPAALGIGLVGEVLGL